MDLGVIPTHVIFNFKVKNPTIPRSVMCMSNFQAVRTGRNIKELAAI